MAHLNVRGANLEFSRHGSGDPVLFVHGSVSDYRTWSQQLPAFSQHFHAITFSRRYHWPNDAIPDGADYSMMEQVGDLEEFVRMVTAVPPHIVGHSYGAYLALLLAMRQPDAVQSLVLAEPPVIPLFVRMPPALSELLRVFVRRPKTAAAIIRFGARGVGPAAQAIKRGDTDTALRLFGSAVLGHETFAKLSAERMKQVRANVIDAEFLGSGFAALPKDEVADITCPTLLLQGERSPSLFRLLLDRLEELIPTAQRSEIPKASHIMHEDNPGVFNAVVLSFLKGCQASARTQ